MLIEEGSVIKIFDNNDRNTPIMDNVIANMDIEISDSDNYTMLFRDEDSNQNAIFETDYIYHEYGTNEYKIFGYFKDALLVNRNKNSNAMFKTYMDI